MFPILGWGNFGIGHFLHIWYAKIVVGQKDNGDDQKVMQLQHMDIPTSKLLDYLHPRLKGFVTHSFVAKW
jgi:hypothetical protein